jgi:PleD family two-component response regulator
MKQPSLNSDKKSDPVAAIKKTILIVDDEPEILVLLKRLLGEYETITASDGAEALDTVNKNSSIDLILLDIAMPDMTGFEVAKKLKGDSSTSHIPIIFVSGKRDLDSFVEGFEIGIEDYITKPIDQNYLLYTVSTKLS